MTFLLPSDSFMCVECGRCSLSWSIAEKGGMACPDCAHVGDPIQVVIVHVDGHEDPIPGVPE